MIISIVRYSECLQVSSFQNDVLLLVLYLQSILIQYQSNKFESHVDEKPEPVIEPCSECQTNEDCESKLLDVSKIS